MLSTHVLSEVEAICDRAIIVNRGRIVAQDTLAGFAQLGGNLRLVVARPDAALDAALRAVPGVASVAGDGPGAFLVKADRDVREAVASAAVRCGLLELAPQRALEEVFLALTRSAA